MRFQCLRLNVQITFLACVANIQSLVRYGTNEIVTCKNKCGKIQTDYCSCDARCLIYKNCCEGIASDCPEILAQAHIKFGHMLNSQVVCDKHVQYMISSCPQGHLDKDTTWSNVEQTTSNQNDSNNVFLMSTTPENKGEGNTQPQTVIQNKVETSRRLMSRAQVRSSMETPFQKTSKSSAGIDMQILARSESEPNVLVTDPTEAVNDAPQNESESNLEFVLRNVPVTQASSGLVFKNLEMFLCNGGKESDIVWWDIVVKYPGLVSIQVLEESIIPSWTAIYTPPRQYLGSIMRCLTESIGVESCVKERLAENGTLGALCQSFKSYVMEKGGKMIYDNRFCMQCSRDAEQDFSPLHVAYEGGKSFQLSMLLSLNQKNSFTLTTRGAGNLPDFISPWEDVTCQLHDEFISQKNVDDLGKGEANASGNNPNVDKQRKDSLNQESFCDIKACSEHFQLQPSGMCKTEHIILAGLSDDGFPLTMNQKTRLPDFLTCGLERYLETDILQMNGPTMTVYDDVQNRSVYLINATILFHFEAEIRRYLYSYEESRKLLNLLRFVRAFKEFRKPRLRAECLFSQHLLKQKKSLDVWKKSQENSATKNMNGLLDLDQETLLATNSVSLGELSSYETNFLANIDRGERLGNSTTKFCFHSAPIFRKKDLKSVYCVDDVEYEKDAEMLQTFCDSPCFSLLTEQDPRSAAFDLSLPLTNKIVSCLIVLIYMELNASFSFT